MRMLWENTRLRRPKHFKRWLYPKEGWGLLESWYLACGNKKNRWYIAVTENGRHATTVLTKAMMDDLLHQAGKKPPAQAEEKKDA
jgi:hypothetical protein